MNDKNIFCNYMPLKFHCKSHYLHFHVMLQKIQEIIRKNNFNTVCVGLQIDKKRL